MYKILFKPIMDYILAFFALIVMAPFLIIIYLLLYFNNQGNPFFFQLRPGKNEKLFSIIKFKTMNDKKDSNGNLLSDSERLTKVGNFVRKTSLDEFPQLINVLKGEMSLIGPRPLLPEYLPLYNEFQKRRHEVKPGLTGWGQVNGRNGISWQKKFKLDIWYIDNISLVLDVKILILTIKKVLISDGISQKNQATVEPFKGNDL
tara:strand:+ start:510 stop:1118 length:609 start_codon:yes stop_codon:yes gene_type:complete